MPKSAQETQPNHGEADLTKILVYTSLYPNGQKSDLGVFIKKRMVAYSKRKNTQIRVVAPIPYFPNVKFLHKYKHFSQIPQKEVIDNIVVYHPRYPLIPKISMPLHGLSMYVATRALVKKIYKEFTFELIDGHFIFPDCQAAVRLGEEFNVPVIVSARGSDINEFIYYRLIKPQILKTLRQATQVVSVCQALKEMMVNEGIKQEKISVVPNGVDKTIFFPLEKAGAMKELGLEPRSKIILSVGALIPRKSHDLTINAVHGLKQKGYKLHLYILGTGPKRNDLETLVRKLKMEDCVTLVGHIPNENLNFWYNAADVFCLASSREGWANVLTESLACGTPAVATHVFGAGEIIRNASLGILVNRSCKSIQQGIEKALNTEWDKFNISDQIRHRTWDVVAQELDSVFKKAIASHR